MKNFPLHIEADVLTRLENMPRRRLIRELRFIANSEPLTYSGYTLLTVGVARAALKALGKRRATG